MRALPNYLTYARIIAVPVLVFVLFWPDILVMRAWGLALFVFAAGTDFLDGYVARVCGAHSAFGRMLDPIADKLLVACALLMLVADGTLQGLSLWPALIIVCREILVSGLREFLAQLQVSVPVSFLAKWKTGVQMLALGVLILGRAGDAWMFSGFTTLGLGLLWAAALLTLYTGYDYMKAGMNHV